MDHIKIQHSTIQHYLIALNYCWCFLVLFALSLVNVYNINREESNKNEYPLLLLFFMIGMLLDQKIC